MAKSGAEESLPTIGVSGLRGRILRFYERFLDFIVVVLIFVMLLTLVASLVGVVWDVYETFLSFREEDAIQGLVSDVLSVFVLIELFRTFTDYLEFHRIRLRVLSEVAIVFVLRELFIGLYAHHLGPMDLIATAVLLAVLVGARVAAVKYAPQSPEKD
ncbi:hypothetical protein B1757_06295 [Acidithiobacillus marinus]|uniref:Protein PsiE n=1 Tax=Acidithiobacillus marinus TaxID=187490 RepID=A0A2I1DMJ7_9PROT|nr:phosphate-starvation-inducible PsiE family protein [Acidithiobacillus marinus]PKY11100.1 hypothetical protein B1757_06295 [Acidithiobacillus marinus]